MTKKDRILADEIFEELWPQFLNMNEPQRVNHKDWNIPPKTSGLKEIVFNMMEIYYKLKTGENAKCVKRKHVSGC
jgi:hypothetical protein